MYKPKILVVEHEILIASEIKKILSDDFEVFINIVNYSEAIEAIKKIQPDLVLINVNIKGLKDGIELGKSLLNYDHIPFIYITSHIDAVTMERLKNTRPYGFLSTPFKKLDLQVQAHLAVNNFCLRKLDQLRSEKDIIDEASLVIRNIINYINENIHDKIEIDELTELTRWKKHHFIRTFSKEIGLTPYQYILKKKIEMAKALIVDTDQPITEIAFDLGFNNYGNFVHIFKKFCQSTPDHYRRAIKLIQNKEKI